MQDHNAMVDALCARDPVALLAVLVKHLLIGDIEVIALNDGVNRRPLTAWFVSNAPLVEVHELLRSQDLPTENPDVPCTAFLIMSGNRKILMDTGFF